MKNCLSAMAAVLSLAAALHAETVSLDFKAWSGIQTGTELPAPLRALAKSDLRLVKRLEGSVGTLFYFEDPHSPEASASILLREGRVIGTIRSAEGTAALLRPLGAGISEVIEVPEEPSSGCGCGRSGDHVPGPEDEGPPDPTAGFSPPPPCDDGTRIDVLVVYTDSAVVVAGSELMVQDQIAWAIADANLAFQNSNVALEVRLVGAHRLAGYMDAQALDFELSRMQSGQVPGLHALRDSLGADLVAMVRPKTSDICGVAFPFNGSPSNPIGPSTSGWAYSVTALECLQLRAMSHEIGHNLGCGHEGNGIGQFPYSKALHYTGASGALRRTNMSSTIGSIPYFSSPLVSFDGMPTGAAGVTDNARTIRELKGIVATFRCDPDWGCGLGGSCFAAQSFEGCSDAACCQAVCVTDPTCCSVVWDAVCASRAFDVCSACGSPAAGSCSSSHANPSCSNADCCRAVCAADPVCCLDSWDALCVSRASSLCPSCGGSAAGPCHQVHPTPYCNNAACCQSVCATLPACCQTTWDAACVAAARSLCYSCGSPMTSSCSVPRTTPSCSEDWCCNGICSTIDPDCCSVAWDQRCVNIANCLCFATCRADITYDGKVDGADLAQLLNAWGSKDSAIEDLDYDGSQPITIDGADLAILLNAWGTCPG